MQLNIFISNEKKVFFWWGERKDAAKGTVLAKYCTLQHQSFPTQ